MGIPFQYGTLATDENFIDRVQERAELKQLLSSGINVTLISPRRWGKSSLVKKAMDEMRVERNDIRICYLDAFSVNSEEEFYSIFASKVISCAAGKIEKSFKEAKKYLSGLIPGITLSDGINEVLSVNLRYKPQEKDKLEILNLPEKIAQDKKIRIIVCIDEFQQLIHLPEYADMEGKMRSVWQLQKKVSYCFYGSKKHMMMDIFGDSHKPFYRFSQIIFMPKISRNDWIPFIMNGFHKTGKTIAEDYAQQICDITECHSWYLQQFCYFLWNATDKEVNETVYSASLTRLIDTNAPMFTSDLEKLTPSQREMLRAIVQGKTKLTSQETLSHYHLGNPNTIIRNKKVLMEKSFVESEDGILTISDPIFKLWYQRYYAS